MQVLLEYAQPSRVLSEPGRDWLGLSANARRPVRFHGRLERHAFLLRVALRALGNVIWSDDTWQADRDILDPVVTVHPDAVFFEAFSTDQSSYAALFVDRALFAVEGEVRCGTTNVDFTSWLHQALDDLRSSRETWLRVEAVGVEVSTSGACERFEKKVDLPLPWVQGFVNLQGAMAMPGIRLRARPVDVLAVVRYLKRLKARVSPRALRFELPPGEEARVLLEPWDLAVQLKGSEHPGEEMRVIRTWGRRRLRLLEPLLPFAERVDIFLKGRALPTFYAVRLPGMTFVLGLSGWTAQRWTDGSTFDLLLPQARPDEGLLARAADTLASACLVSEQAMGHELGVATATAAALLGRLCRLGRAVYDLERRAYRHRELFEPPLQEAVAFPPDPRREKAHALVEGGEVQVGSSTVREKRTVRNLRNPASGERATKEVVVHDRHVAGRVGAQESVEVVVNERGRIVFGTCGCRFFQENLLNLGPCEHILALFLACESLPVDSPRGEGGMAQPRLREDTRP